MRESFENLVVVSMLERSRPQLWRSTIPAGDFARTLHLRGGFDPSIVTGLVLGFVLARMLSPLTPEGPSAG